MTGVGGEEGGGENKERKGVGGEKKEKVAGL